VEWRGERLLYSGDFKLRAGRSAETAQTPRADVVVMETTFGRPHYRLPPTDEIAREVRHFCRRAWEEGAAPVLLCYSLGKGQEILAHLDELERPIYLHARHFEMSNLYREHGVALPPFRLYEEGQTLDGVLLCASGCRKGRWFHELQATHQLRTAYLSGWALDPGARWRFKSDAAFALSDHADYDDLLEYARHTRATTIYTLHGFAAEFAADLRAQGLAARTLI
jgi:Cft2 family RNA processing exonuclease